MKVIRHPIGLVLRTFPRAVVLALVCATTLISCATNRLEERVFRNKLQFRSSPSHFLPDKQLKLAVLVMQVTDSLEKYKGALVLPDNAEARIADIWDRPVSNILSAEMRKNLSEFKWLPDESTTAHVVRIEPELKIFYPYIQGVLWVKVYAFVRIGFRVYVDDKLRIDKDYDNTYVTDGTDKEYEGSIVDTFEGMANIAMGISLRIVLDRLYQDIEKSVLLSHSVT